MESWKEELYHHGIKGQKWGVRRYQNPDGTLTAAGRRRAAREYNYKESDAYKNAKRYKRANMTSTYNANKKLLGEKAANKIEYKVNVEGANRQKVQSNELGKQALIGFTASALIVAAPILVAAGQSWYEEQKAYLDFNNKMVDLYAMANNIKDDPNIGVGLGLNEINQGKRFYSRLKNFM